MKRKFFLGLIFLIGLSILLVFVKDKLSRDEVLMAKQSRYIYSPNKDELVYYWFSVGVRTRTPDRIYRIISVSNEIRYGKIKKFEKALWKGLAKRKIVIGPFISHNEAKKAITLYKAITKAKTKEDLAQIKLPDFGHELYWFQIKFIESPRMKAFVLEHGPASVRSGNARLFIYDLLETLGYQQMTVGPFEDYQRTEEIKRIYRQNE